MQFGYDDNKIRVRPSFSGQKATCPLCNDVIIGKCGKIYVWHWQHHHSRECDPWKEHETDWHRKWKAKFPDDWQEVIIENEGEKHIADVKTSDGIVIEFQNSPISSSTISIREDFYEDMIWVVNARIFKDNFKIRSVVSSWLRSIDRNASNELTSLQETYKEDLKSVADDIEKDKRETADKFSSIKFKKDEVEKLKQLLKDHEVFTNAVINKWSQGESYWGYKISDITDKIEYEIRNQLYTITTEIRNVQADIKSNEESLLAILKLENLQVADKPFKIVQYGQIPSTSFQRARTISKASRKTFFPEIIEFKSETEFLRFKYRKEQFDFVVDPTIAINSFTLKIEYGKKSVEVLEQSLLVLRKKITDQLVKELKTKIQQIESEIEKLNNERDELIKESSRLIERQVKIIAMRDKDISESKVEIVKRKNEKRFKVMKEKKGLYTFDWKHERKSWKAAYSSIYFDTGESYLFEKIRDGVFKKTEISEFLVRHLQNNPDRHTSPEMYNSS